MEKAIVLLQIQKVPQAEVWTLDPGWVIAALIGIVGYLLVRILNHLVANQKTHGDKIEKQEIKSENHEVRITTIEKNGL